MTLDETILFCTKKTDPKNNGYDKVHLTEKEYEQIANWLKELKQYRRQKYKKKQAIKKKTSSNDSSAWDFHYDGYGNYEEQRRCFYGDFG